MRLRLLTNPVTYIVILLYLFVPMLDSMVCTDCLGNAPFQGETTIGHLQAPHDDVSYSSQEGTEPDTSSARDAKSFCSICANVLLGVEVVSPPLPIFIVQCHSPGAVPALSELHYSINKPPQNLPV